MKKIEEPSPYTCSEKPRLLLSCKAAKARFVRSAAGREFLLGSQKKESGLAQLKIEIIALGGKLYISYTCRTILLPSQVPSTKDSK